MIVYASLRLVVRHHEEADEERCLCGAPHDHPTPRWACTARSSLYARILQQRGAWLGTAAGIEPVLDNGRNDESPESAQTLFSWAEFMAEGPVRPKSRSRKPQPASLSMFEWALGMERERTEELVGAGR